jgi:adenylate kinase
VLEVEITDDGVGMPKDCVAGVGLSSMRERMEELGGTLAIERLSGRRTSEATGRIYQVVYDPPPENSGEDPGPFVQRKDDTEEAIRRRLKIYHDHTEPLKNYYAGRSILAPVDATRRITDVTEDILRAARPRNRRSLEDHDKPREEAKDG